MPRSMVESRPCAWPRVIVLALIGIVAAGCSDSARFNSSSYNADRPAPPQNVSSIPAPPASTRVEAQPLPALSQPATVSAAPSTYGTQSPSIYRTPKQYSDVTGSAAAASAPSGHWAWNGGSAVTVGYGETIDTIARNHHVPASALMQTNGIRDASQIRPGQRLVIPRYVSNAPQTAAAHAPTQVAAGGNVHVVQSGDTLMNIARRSGVTLTALAQANHIQSSSKLSIGDRLTIPAGAHPIVAAAHPAPTPQVAQPRAVATEKVASAQVQNAQVAKEEPHTTETVVKTAEPSGAMPAFRWPVRGRVIAGFRQQAERHAERRN